MNRRLFLSLIAGTVALPHVVRAIPSAPPQPHRLILSNPHTNEKFSGVYRDDNGPIPRVMEELSVFLRDFHSGETIDTHFGVIENSQHIFGRALDVHFGDKLADAMKAARAMQRGGVGWYPHSSFMHIDTGPVRNWDLDRAGLGTLLAGRHRIRFNKKGDMLVSSRGRMVGGKMVAARGEPPLGVRDRLARLRRLARAEYFARKQ